MAFRLLLLNILTFLGLVLHPLCSSGNSPSYSGEAFLLFSPQCFDGTNDEGECGNIVQIIQHPIEGLIYVATEGGLYELNRDMEMITYTTTATVYDGVVNDFIILIDIGILICKNNPNGSCEVRDVKSLDVMEGFYQANVVKQNHGGYTVSWVSRGPTYDGDDVIYIAISSSEGVSVPTLSTRYLQTGRTYTDDFLAVLRDKYLTPTAQKFFSGDYFPNNVIPIYGFSHGNFNFVLECQLDYRNINTKLIRLCKNDTQYHSYIELPINCIYNYGLKMTLATSAYMINGTLVIAFTNNDLMGPVSVVCQYEMEEINKRFTERRKECLTGKTKSTEMEWDKNIFCPIKPIPPEMFDISQLDDPDFCYNLDTAHPLGGNDPIQSTSLFYVNVTVNAVLFIQHHNDTVFFLGDSEGYLLKKRLRGEIWQTETILAMSEKEAILSPHGLQLDIYEDVIYVVSSNQIVQCPTVFVEDHQKSQKEPQNWTSVITLCAVFTFLVGTMIFAFVIIYKHRRGHSWYR